MEGEQKLKPWNINAQKQLEICIDEKERWCNLNLEIKLTFYAWISLRKDPLYPIKQSIQNMS